METLSPPPFRPFGHAWVAVVGLGGKACVGVARARACVWVEGAGEM